jgi:hypothetical protein
MQHNNRKSYPQHTYRRRRKNCENKNQYIYIYTRTIDNLKRTPDPL